MTANELEALRRLGAHAAATEPLVAEVARLQQERDAAWKLWNDRAEEITKLDAEVTRLIAVIDGLKSYYDERIARMKQDYDGVVEQLNHWRRT